MHSTLRQLRFHSIAALIGLAIVVAACTAPAGASPSPGRSAPGGVVSSTPAVSASAEPTKGGY